MESPRILVIRLTALGDVVLVEPVARALRDRYPDATIDLVTEARVAPLMARGAGFDQVIGYDRRGRHAGWRGITRLLRALPHQRYDLVIDLQGKLRTRVLAARLGSPRRVVLRKRGLFAALRALFGNDPPITARHSVQIYLDALAPLGLPAGASAEAPRLSVPRPARDPGVLRVGLGLGTTHATKRWSSERFAELATLIAGAHPTARFVAIGGAEDRALIDRFRAEVDPRLLEPVDTPALDLVALSELLGGLDLLIGVDSGPAHLAAALGVPVLVLFGPTSPRRWGPIGAQHRSVSLELDCSPCSNTGSARCPRADRDHACMRDLEVARVWQETRPMMAALRER